MKDHRSRGRRGPALVIGVLAMSLPLAGPSFARADNDILELKTGQRVEGTFVGASGGRVSIEVGGQTITFDQVKVRSIVFGSLPGAPSSSRGEPAKEEFVAAPAPSSAPTASPAAPAPTPAPPRQGSAPAPPSSTSPASAAPAAPAAPPAPASPAPSAARAPSPGPSTASGSSTLSSMSALFALKALRSAAQPGITYGEYAQRVAEAKAAVDPYLAEGETSAPKDALRDAMDYYAYAATSWQAGLSWAGYAEYIQIGSNPLATKCPQLEQEIKSAPQVSNAVASGRTPKEVFLATGVVIANRGAPKLWACASDKIDEADELLAPKPGSASR